MAGEKESLRKRTELAGLGIYISQVDRIGNPIFSLAFRAVPEKLGEASGDPLCFL